MGADDDENAIATILLAECGSASREEDGVDGREVIVEGHHHGEKGKIGEGGESPRAGGAGKGEGQKNQLSYEVDLFGSVRRALEGARASAEAQGAAYQGVLLALQAGVAEDYFNLRSWLSSASSSRRTFPS